MHFKNTLIILIVIFFSGIVTASEEMSLSGINEALKRAENIQIELPENNNKEALDAAKKAAEYVESEEFKLRLNVERKRIKQILLSDEDLKREQPDLLPSDRIYIFISSSMPEETLKAYIRDIDHLNEANITMVLRGFVDGAKKIKPTLEFIENLVTKSKDCDISDSRCKSYRANIDIDPMAFRYFNVEKVPAVIFAENISLLYPDKSIGEIDNLKTMGGVLKFYGDMPLKYIFRKFKEKNQKFEKLITKLEKRGFYNE